MVLFHINNQWIRANVSKTSLTFPICVVVSKKAYVKISGAQKILFGKHCWKVIKYGNIQLDQEQRSKIALLQLLLSQKLNAVYGVKEKRYRFDAIYPGGDDAKSA